MEAKPFKIPHPFKKLSYDLIDTIVSQIEEGSTQKHAALSNKISEAVFYIWIQQGKLDMAMGRETLCSHLVHRLAEVQQEEIKQCRQKIKKSARGHYGSQWTLEKVYAKQFSGNAVVMEFDEQLSQLEMEQYGKTQNENEEQAA